MAVKSNISKIIIKYKIDAEEAIAEALDFLWYFNGKFNWIQRKLRYSPYLISNYDKKEVEKLMELRDKQKLAIANPLQEFKSKINSIEEQKVFEYIKERVDRICNKLNATKVLLREMLQKIKVNLEISD
jgi:hypothetical protein